MQFTALEGLSELQGTTGKELMQLDDEILAQIGIKNPLHRMQLINARNDLLAQQDQSSGSTSGSPAASGSRSGSPAASKPASPTPMLSPRVSHT